MGGDGMRMEWLRVRNARIKSSQRVLVGGVLSDG